MVRLRRLGLDKLSGRTRAYIARKQEEAQSLAPGDGEAAHRFWEQFRKTKASRELWLLIRSESGGKCAYCEMGEASDFDHLSAKSLEPRRVVDYGNLLPSCETCNRGKGTVLVLDPYEQDPDPHFLYIEETGGMEPHPGSVHAGLALSTIQACRLGREKLRGFRREVAMAVRYFAAEVARRDRPREAVELLMVLLKPDGPHVGLVRFLLRTDPQVAAHLQQARASDPCVDALLSAFPYADD